MKLILCSTFHMLGRAHSKARCSGQPSSLLLLSHFAEINCNLSLSVLWYQTWHLLVFCCSPFTQVCCASRDADLQTKVFFQSNLPSDFFLSPSWPFSLIFRGCASNPSWSAAFEILKPAIRHQQTMPHSKSLESPFFPILVAQFELWQVILTTFACLNALSRCLPICTQVELSRCTSLLSKLWGKGKKTQQQT